MKLEENLFRKKNLKLVVTFCGSENEWPNQGQCKFTFFKIQVTES